MSFLSAKNLDAKRFEHCLKALEYFLSQCRKNSKLFWHEVVRDPCSESPRIELSVSGRVLREGLAEQLKEFQWDWEAVYMMRNNIYEILCLD